MSCPLFSKSYAPILAVLLAVGCGPSGPSRQPVSGTVTYGGEPVENGTISFIPTGTASGAAGGGIITAGKYSLTAENGPVLGKHKVEIRGTRKTGKKIPAAPPATGEVEVTEDYIPAKYNTATTLDADIKGAGTTIDFKLEK